VDIGERVAVLEERVSTLAKQQTYARNASDALDRRLEIVERYHAEEEIREEERARIAVRAASRASSSERRRFALAGTAIAVLTAVSPHIHSLHVLGL